ncbi:hypothetical protein ACQKDS_16195 [Serratia sp. NPDC078593]|uniref:hypothetical protein n=1 Tax=unclassified Serratia (in: enterobacteria) TaxID=2647522 RepID=UPI0037D579C1
MMQISLHGSNKRTHINQYIYGLLQLQRQGLVKIKNIDFSDNIRNGVLKLTVNGQKIIYDGDDGDHIDRNFFHEEDHEWCDFYFKRSCSARLKNKYAKVFPLGLAYELAPDYSHSRVLRDGIKRLFGKGVIKHYDLECKPRINTPAKILFITGLWDPQECSHPEFAAEANAINACRLMTLDTLAEHYGSQATIGLGDTALTRRLGKKYVLDSATTSRKNFIQKIKSHDICIASTGLHGSIGWRFGEYVAASRAIVSETLNYIIPGDFSIGKNYLNYHDRQSLIASVDALIKDDEYRHAIMQNNYDYYQDFLRPDRMMLRTLCMALETPERLTAHRQR